MRAISKKRRRLLAERAAVRQQAIARDGRCMSAHLLPHIACAGIPEANEIIRRSQLPGGWLELDNIQVHCTAHHRYLTEHPDWAHAHGFQAHARPYDPMDKIRSRTS